MKKIYLLLLFCWLCAAPCRLSAQCPPGFDSVRVEIDPDKYFYECRWKIYEKTDSTIVYGSGILLADSLHIFNLCVPQGECKVLELADDNGDGFFPDGWYRLYVNGELIRQSVGYFGPSQSTDFACPPGSSCNSPINITLGSGSTPDSSQTWFSFTPVDTGIYVIATCGAACATKIWVYDICNDLLLSEGLPGALFYAENGCPDGAASTSALLKGGTKYFIRIRYFTPGCSPDSIPYTLSFSGPIVGCMDPAACNYEPLATVNSGICLYPGDPDCPQAPDIAIDQELLVNSLVLDDQFSDNPCYIQEGCLRGFGNRHVIKFDTRITNIGNADYFVGPKPTDPNAPSGHFIFDPCHGHYHYLGYAEYILFNSAGKRIPIGSKNGFCVLDAQCPFGITKKYTCQNMGITAQCSDVYQHANTPCQWIDITDIPADDYTMVARVNWDRRPDKIGRVEKTFDNNWAQACFTLVYDGDTPDVIFRPDSCPQYTDCTGTVFGNAQPDCNGICNGPALFGDWNLDTLRNTADVQSYLAAALDGSGQASPCNDLHEDGQINVFDAALLQECALYADSQQYWIQRFPCQFPTGLFNEQDLVTLLPGALDTVAKTFDIQMVNPANRMMAYEFSVSGILIGSVENLSPEFHATPQFKAATGKIIALAADESSIPKNPMPSPFLRVHYTQLTDHEVCVSDITAVVNSKYQRSNATLGIPNCLPVTFVQAQEPNAAPFAVFVQPNPMQESTTVFFENKNAEPMRLVLSDVRGKTLRTFEQLRGESITIQRSGLPDGTYFFVLQNSRGSVAGKLMMW